MINWKQAKKYCCDKISLIENYDKAKRDLLETWHIHHRKEDEGYSKQDLIALGMYYERPASELIFLTRKEHVSLHSKGVPKSEETRRKISEANKGVKNYMYGKHHSKKTKKKMSESKKGEKCYLYKKTGDKHPRSKQIVQIDKKTGEIIRTWSCAMEVQRQFGIFQSNISLCCSGKLKSAGGYVWKYAG